MPKGLELAAPGNAIINRQNGTFAKGNAFRSIPKEGLTQLILQI